MTQVGHTGLFCNPKILLNSFMFWDFKASSPFLYCPVSLQYSQIEGIDFDTVPVQYRPLAQFDGMIKRAGMKIRHEGERAYYSPSDDFINMPFKGKFKTQTAYYQTLAHELIHSTMKDSRCNRTIDNKDGRALEELTAEIGSAYLLAEFGVKADLQNTAAYVQSWIKALKNNKNYIFKASKDAKTAVKYLKRFM